MRLRVVVPGVGVCVCPKPLRQSYLGSISIRNLNYLYFSVFEKTNLAVCECEVGEPHAVASLKIVMIMIGNDKSYVMFGRTLYIVL